MRNPLSTKPRPITLYKLLHRHLGEERVVAAHDAQEACHNIGWMIGDCYVIEIHTWNADESR